MEDEVKAIIAKILEGLLKSYEERERKAVQGRVGLELEEVGVDSPHGVYMYDPGKKVWRLIAVEGGPFKPREDGIYVVYFDNTRCPACRIYDFAWYRFVEEESRRGNPPRFVIVLCDWFAHECRSDAAAASFRWYRVHASPTTLFLYVKNGEVVEEERREGALRLEELAATYLLFKKRVSR